MQAPPHNNERYNVIPSDPDDNDDSVVRHQNEPPEEPEQQLHQDEEANHQHQNHHLNGVPNASVPKESTTPVLSGRPNSGRNNGPEARRHGNLPPPPLPPNPNSKGNDDDALSTRRRRGGCLVIGSHHVVLHLSNMVVLENNSTDDAATATDATTTSTRGTELLHEACDEYHNARRRRRRHNTTTNTTTTNTNTTNTTTTDDNDDDELLTLDEATELWTNLQQAVRDEHLWLSRRDANDILLVECTDTARRQGLWEEDNVATHGFTASSSGQQQQQQQQPKYAVVTSRPEAALVYYYNHVWRFRIPTQTAERRAWVAHMEDLFCDWQQKTTMTVPHIANDPHWQEKIENVRLAIQFVKKYLARPEPGVTEQMIPSHLELIQKGWHELQQGVTVNTDEQRQASMPQQDIPSLTFPRDYFQILPTDHTDRLLYLQRIRHNYNSWKNCIVAQQFRRNVLLAFEKLMKHTSEWLSLYTNNNSVAESTLQMFFGLLKERWNEFMDKTDKYAPVLLKRSRQDNNDDDDDDNAGRPKKTKTSHDDQSQNDNDKDNSVTGATQMAVESNLPMVEEHNAQPVTTTATLPAKTVEWAAFDDCECSQVSAPFAKYIDENPLRSDATKGLCRAVDQNNLEQVEHFFAQGATANLCDEFGDTPLHRGAAVGGMPILVHLRLWGADPRIRNSAGELAVHVAAWYGHADAVSFFLRQLKALSLSSLVDDRGRTPLHHACHQGHVAVARVLVESFQHEHVIEMLDEDRLSPRHYALMGGHVEMVQYLDGLGAKRSDDGAFDPNSLFDACATGRLNLAKWLAESSYVDPKTVRDEQGRSPADLARMNGHTRVLEWIKTCT